jgi:hypothetical protein
MLDFAVIEAVARLGLGKTGAAGNSGTNASFVIQPYGSAYLQLIITYPQRAWRAQAVSAVCAWKRL